MRLFLLVMIALGSMAGCDDAGGDDTGGGGSAPGGAGGSSGGAGGGGGTADTLTFELPPTAEALVSEVVTVRARANRPALARVTLSGGASGQQDFGSPRQEFEVVFGGLAPGEAHLVTFSLQDSQDAGLRATAEVAFTTPAATAARVVLFDAAHGEDAGNADWLVDEPGSTRPSPDEPSGPEDWAGAYSSFGYALWSTGRFEIRTNPRGRALDAGALAGVDVLVLPEANERFSAAELDAIWAFVRAGGGLLAIGNHAGSDRDFDGYDGADVLDLLLADAPEIGVRAAKDDINREAPTTKLGDHPTLRGPFGRVASLGFYDATTLLLEGTVATPVASTSNGAGVLIAALPLGQGRVVIVGDSAGIDDGTGHGNNELFDGWTDFDNQRFYPNAVSWLAGEYGAD